MKYLYYILYVNMYTKYEFLYADVSYAHTLLLLLLLLRNNIYVIHICKDIIWQHEILYKSIVK